MLPSKPFHRGSIWRWPFLVLSRHGRLLPSADPVPFQGSALSIASFFSFEPEFLGNRNARQVLLQCLREHVYFSFSFLNPPHRCQSRLLLNFFFIFFFITTVKCKIHEVCVLSRLHHSDQMKEIFFFSRVFWNNRAGQKGTTGGPAPPWNTSILSPPQSPSPSPFLPPRRPAGGVLRGVRA